MVAMSRRVLALVVLLGFLGTVACADASGWGALSEDQLVKVRVGTANDMCCIKITYHRCNWGCVAAPANCVVGTTRDGKCKNDAKCVDKPNATCTTPARNGMRAGTRCVMSGMKTAVGCPMGEERCLSNLFNINVPFMGACNAGETLCTVGQPTHSCN